MAKATLLPKQQMVINPHLGKDLRNIGILTLGLIILLVILWAVL